MVRSVDAIRRRLERHRARIAPDPPAEGWRAAVAVVLHQPEAGPPELLFIERARRAGDPWSGQMAFPGGRSAPEDPDLQATAARETHEEVGIRLPAPLGRLDDFEGSRAARPRPLVVSPFVYELPERPEIVTNYEVQSTLWVPLPAIVDPAFARPYRFERSDFQGTFPSVRYDGYTIWGLTYRILSRFVEVLGHEVPEPELGREGSEPED